MQYQGHDIAPAADSSGFVITNKDGQRIGQFARERDCEEFLFICIVAANKVPTPELWRQYTEERNK